MALCASSFGSHIAAFPVRVIVGGHALSMLAEIMRSGMKLSVSEQVGSEWCFIRCTTRVTNMRMMNLAARACFLRVFEFASPYSAF